MNLTPLNAQHLYLYLELLNFDVNQLSYKTTTTAVSLYIHTSRKTKDVEHKSGFLTYVDVKIEEV